MLILYSTVHPCLRKCTKNACADTTLLSHEVLGKQHAYCIYMELAHVDVVTYSRGGHQLTTVHNGETWKELAQSCLWQPSSLQALTQIAADYRTVGTCMLLVGSLLSEHVVCIRLHTKLVQVQWDHNQCLYSVHLQTKGVSSLSENMTLLAHACMQEGKNAVSETIHIESWQKIETRVITL
jgi:hypothetical protein